MRVKERVAIVTGGGRGIGKGISLSLAKEGANVAIFGKTLDVVDETAEEIRKLGRKSLAAKVDVSNSPGVHEAVQQVLDYFGHVDILVNAAGIFPPAPFVDTPDEVRDSIMNVNMNGVWNCTKAVIISMIKRRYGKIVNISSVTGPIVSNKGTTAYSASKGAVSGFTRALALEMAEHNINVNAICPGFVDSYGIRTLNKNRGFDPDKRLNELGKSIPLGRLGTTSEIGDLAVFLASDDSKYMTGTEIVFDGGNIIQEMKVS